MGIIASSAQNSRITVSSEVELTKHLITGTTPLNSTYTDYQTNLDINKIVGFDFLIQYGAYKYLPFYGDSDGLFYYEVFAVGGMLRLTLGSNSVPYIGDRTFYSMITCIK